MRIDIRELEAGPLKVTGEVLPEDLNLDPVDLKVVGRIPVTLTVEKAGREIRVRGGFQAELLLVCSRCLEPIEFSLAPQFDQFYQPVGSSHLTGEIALQEKDTDIAFFRGDFIEVVDVVREQIVLAVPMKPMCREDCQGLCPYCGRNRNLESCDCRALVQDPRLAPLLKIKNRRS
jgi:uncharacterized protein